jgi:hypothetical protein
LLSLAVLVVAEVDLDLTPLVVQVADCLVLQV